ncbi:hypothetical protein ABID94_003340 [Streptomyces sp. PvR018]
MDHEVHRRRRHPARAEGHEIHDEDITRLSPLKHRNLNQLGRYSFTASVPASGALRPLRRNWTRTTRGRREQDVDYWAV